MNSQDILGPASGRIIDIVNSEVVISHYSDNAECRSLDILGRRLEVAADISVWIDRWDLASRTSAYHTAALGAIKRSNIFIAVISQEYIENQDCRDELVMAIESCKFIIPVLGPGWKGKGGSDWWKDAQEAEEASQVLKDADIARSASARALSETTKIEWWMLETVRPIDMRDEFNANDKTLPVGGMTESTILQHVLSRFHEGAAISHAEEDQYLMWRKKHGWLVRGLEAVTKPGVSEEEVKEAVKKAFDEIDTDGSGGIDKVELFHAMEKAAGAELDVHDMDKLFSKVCFVSIVDILEGPCILDHLHCYFFRCICTSRTQHGLCVVYPSCFFPACSHGADSAKPAMGSSLRSMRMEVERSTWRNLRSW
jgi:hypothetical protein